RRRRQGSFLKQHFSERMNNQKVRAARRKGSGISLNLDRSAVDALVMSLQSLQRWDSSIDAILGNASHVVIYVYDVANGEWKRKNVEGSFFVVRRGSAAISQGKSRHALAVLNRAALDNLGHDITADFRVDANTPPYLIYRHAPPGGEVPEIYGIWFHDSQEREAMHQLILRAVAADFAGGALPEARASSAASQR
ncbi:unnamed protein product, partial [Heterosigma akashiwo]